MIQLDVPGMKTERCRMTVMGALTGIDPAAKCQIDAERGRVAVDTTYPPSDFIEALEEVGYASFVSQV
jgi:copper chaperone CopZ